MNNVCAHAPHSEHGADATTTAQGERKLECLQRLASSGSQLTWRSQPLAPRSCKPDMFGVASTHEGTSAWHE